MSAGAIGLSLGLASAVVWGSADFAGGVATRRAHPFQVLVLISISGCAVMAVLAALASGPRPSVRTLHLPLPPVSAAPLG
jgi:drug/metabolite transporter (DMT)-like permease